MNDTINGWLALVGGLSGVCMIAYFCLMVYFARKRDRDITELRVQTSKIEGILLGGRRK